MNEKDSFKEASQLACCIFYLFTAFTTLAKWLLISKVTFIESHRGRIEAGTRLERNSNPKANLITKCQDKLKELEGTYPDFISKFVVGMLTPRVLS